MTLCSKLYLHLHIDRNHSNLDLAVCHTKHSGHNFYRISQQSPGSLLGLLCLCWVLHDLVGLESRLLLLVDPGVGCCSSIRLFFCVGLLVFGPFGVCCRVMCFLMLLGCICCSLSPPFSSSRSSAFRLLFGQLRPEVCIAGKSVSHHCFKIRQITYRRCQGVWQDFLLPSAKQGKRAPGSIQPPPHTPKLWP